MRALANALAAAVALAAAPAAAGPTISLNGVNIDGATSQRFENCTVTIDSAGNVNIEAKDYTVRRSSGSGRSEPSAALPSVPLERPTVAAAPAAAAPAAPAEPAKLTRRYFLATEQTQQDGTQYDIEVFVNAKWIRQLRSNEGQVVIEVTKYLRPGPNRVVLAARKHVEGGRHSSSKDVTFRVVVGEGNVGGDNVMIDRPLVEMQRTAAETEDVTQEFTLDAR